MSCCFKRNSSSMLRRCTHQQSSGNCKDGTDDHAKNERLRVLNACMCVDVCVHASAHTRTCTLTPSDASPFVGPVVQKPNLLPHPPHWAAQQCSSAEHGPRQFFLGYRPGCVAFTAHTTLKRIPHIYVHVCTGLVFVGVTKRSSGIELWLVINSDPAPAGSCCECHGWDGQAHRTHLQD